MQVQNKPTTTTLLLKISAHFSTTNTHYIITLSVQKIATTLRDPDL